MPTPERRQTERTECLAVSLGIVLAYHGRHVPPAELRAACGVGRDGATVGRAVRVARAHGLAVRAVRRGTVAALQALQAPFVAYLDHNHAVVVEGVGEASVWLNDPAAGRVRLPVADFDARFTGLALTLRPEPDFEPQAEVPTPDPLAWTPAERRVATVVVAGNAVAGAALAAAAWALPAGRPAAGLLAILAFATWFVAGHAADVLVQRVAAREAGVVSALLFGRPAGDALARDPSVGGALLGAIDGPAGLVDALAVSAFWTAAGAGAALAAALGGHAVLAAVAATALVLALAEPWTLARDARLRRAALHAPPAPAGTRVFVPPDALVEWGLKRDAWVSGLRASIEAANRGVALGERDRGRALARRVLAAASPGVALVTGAALPVALLGAAAVLWAPRLGWLWGPVRSFARHRVAFLDSPDRPPSEPAEPAAPVLVFDGVAFGFAGAAPLLTGVSFRVGPGEVVAVVGPSGGGKSALVALAGGLHAPTAGTVRLGRADAARLPDDVRTAVLGVVPQRPAFWPGTVRDLVDMGRGEADDRLRAALDASGGRAVALARRVGADGWPLSTGERAAVGLARVEVERPPLVVLDETLDALGPALARTVVERMRSEGRGVLVVTHDAALAALADRVLEVTSGRLMPVDLAAL